MTTFTTEDRENAVGVTINVEPIPFAGMVTLTETAYINKEDGLVCAKCYKPFTKELTDKEIKEVWMNRPANTAEDVIAFARAILRKAQEK
jgi:hypothetical protein